MRPAGDPRQNHPEERKGCNDTDDDIHICWFHLILQSCETSKGFSGVVFRSALIYINM